MRLKIVLGIVVAGFLMFLLIQLIPYGHNHTNPPVSQEIKWNSSQTRDLAVRACYDCHSNETAWPWYTNIAPVSWLTQHDVEEGRQYLNFSEWDKPQQYASKIIEQIQSGNMPKRIYLPIHPPANLTPAEKQALIQGLTATLGQSQ
jgi:hypothetical protein